LQAQGIPSHAGNKISTSLNYRAKVTRPHIATIRKGDITAVIGKARQAFRPAAISSAGSESRASPVSAAQAQVWRSDIPHPP